MLYRLLGAAALVLGVAIPGAAPLAAQQPDSVRRPHVMATVVVSGGRSRRATAAENTKLRRELARYDSRILTLQNQLDSLRTVADSLDRDRVYFEAAADQARMRRMQIEQRLRQLEARPVPAADTGVATP
jgi:septal ring factor EnvC (AmiA/AmiB activator)